MKIAIFTVSENYHAPVIIRSMLLNYAADDMRVYITQRSNGKGKLKYLVNLIKKLGVKYVLASVFARFKYITKKKREMKTTFNIKKREYFTLLELLSCFNVAHELVNDINNPQFIKKVHSERFDVVLSIYFDQYFKKKILTKLPDDIFNIHPSLLPAYKGISPVFWALANNERFTGTTLHRIVQGYDQGEIVSQKLVAITDADTVFSLYRRCSTIGSELVLNILDDILNGIIIKQKVKLEEKIVTPSYYSHVTPEGYRSFSKNNRNLL